MHPMKQVLLLAIAATAMTTPTRTSELESLRHATEWLNVDSPLSVEWEDSGMDREAGAAEAAQFCKNIDFRPSGRAFDAAFSD